MSLLNTTMSSAVSSNAGIGQATCGSDTKKAPSDNGFADRLRHAIQETNQSQLDADKSIEQVVHGTLGIHEGMLKIQEADMSLRLLLQVRAKVMEAYREIIHMSF